MTKHPLLKTQLTSMEGACLSNSASMISSAVSIIHIIFGRELTMYSLFGRNPHIMPNIPMERVASANPMDMAPLLGSSMCPCHDEVGCPCRADRHRSVPSLFLL